MDQSITIGFIGAGRMGQAISKGLTSAGLVKEGNLIASDVDQQMLGAIKEIGVYTTTDNCELVKKSDIIILAVKPPTVPAILKQVYDLITAEKLVVSIAAGVTIATIEDLLLPGTRIVRVMPNTPALVGAGAAYIAPGSAVKPGDVDLVANLFKSIGISETGAEAYLDAVTGLSGSGPAYVFAMIESMADGGVKMGLQRDIAMRLAAQTVMGAAKMVLETGSHPGVLKDAVCSPGGTTIAGMHQLEKAGFRGAVIDAIEAGTLRSRELGTKKIES